MEFSSPVKYTNKVSKSKTPHGDRFIPSRGSNDMEIGHYLMKENSTPNLLSTDNACLSPRKEGYKESIAESLFDGKMQKGTKVLAFKSKAPMPQDSTQNPHKVLYSNNKTATVAPKTATKFARHIPKNPERILDAPEIGNDWYLNLIDWSAANVLAIALNTTCYLWDASNGRTVEFMNVGENNQITSVNWSQDGNYLAVGTRDGVVELWDTVEQKKLRNMRGHAARVGSLSWNNFVLSSGSKDSEIHNHDVRQKEHCISVFSASGSQEICGLKWSPDGTQLASGDNGNLVRVWDINTPMGVSPLKHTFAEHTGAVKALAWCPWQKDLLATGGGSADRKICFWNTNTGALLNSIDTQAQVSALQWSKNPNCKEIVSAHGYSQNQLMVWKYPSMVKVAELHSHEQRVLNMCMSPDGTTVVSAGADESLRFWRIFENEVASKPKTEVATSSSNFSKFIR